MFVCTALSRHVLSRDDEVCLDDRCPRLANFFFVISILGLHTHVHGAENGQWEVGEVKLFSWNTEGSVGPTNLSGAYPGR